LAQNGIGNLPAGQGSPKGVLEPKQRPPKKTGGGGENQSCKNNFQQGLPLSLRKKKKKSRETLKGVAHTGKPGTSHIMRARSHKRRVVISLWKKTSSGGGGGGGERRNRGSISLIAFRGKDSESRGGNVSPSAREEND